MILFHEDPGYFGVTWLLHNSLSLRRIVRHSLSHETFAFDVLPRVGAGWDVSELRDGVEAHAGVVERHEAHVVVPDDLLRQDLRKIIHTSDSILQVV